MTLALTKTYLGVTSTTDDALLETLIDRSSAYIQRYLGRTLTSQRYYEWTDTFNSGRVALKHNPMQFVGFVGAGSESVITVNATIASDVFASITVNDVNVHLFRVSSIGTESSTTLTFASYDTTSEMATQINATTGFSASSLLSVPTKYLHKLAGRELKNSTAYLTAPTESLADYSIDYERGIIYGPTLKQYQSLLVDYTGGYSEIPFDLQQAAIELTARSYRGRLRDPGLSSESLGGYSYSARSVSELEASTKSILDSYRRLR